MQSALHALAVVVATSALSSCSDTYEWRSAGVHQVRVDQLMVPETIASDEVLPIHLYGHTELLGRLTLSRLDVVRESTEIELTVWAEVEVCTGDGCPPCGCGIDVDYEVQPPFELGELRVVANQPDGSQLVESVLVQPGAESGGTAGAGGTASTAGTAGMGGGGVGGDGRRL